MPELKPRDLLARFQRAETDRASWNGLLRDAYRYAAPEFDTGFQGIGSQGNDRRAWLFDSTAVQAVEDSASATQQTLTPSTETFLRIEPTPAAAAALQAQDDQGERQVRVALDELTEKFFEHLNASNFHDLVASVYIQEAVSTGILVMNEGHKGADSAFSFEVVPLYDVYPEASAGSIWRTVWRRLRKTAQEIEPTWPTAELPAGLKRVIAENPCEPVELIDGVVYDWEKDDYAYVVLWRGTDDASLLLQDRQKTSPFLEFRSQVAPGEMLGRGRVLAVLPDIKSLNKTVELVLKNASIAVTGIWQADDDGVLNPATIKLIPGSIIPKAVGSSGLEPLKAPGNFDVSEMLISDLRQRVRLAIVGPELPALERRRDVTATEMDYRAGEVQLLRTPRLLRLWPTIVRMVQRGLDILARRGDEAAKMPGIGRELRVLPVSRMVQMQYLADVMRARSAIAVAGEMFPQSLPRVIDADAACEWMLRRGGGLPEELFTDQASRAQARARDEENASMAQTAELANRAAPMVKALSPAAGPAPAPAPEEVSNDI